MFRVKEIHDEVPSLKTSKFSLYFSGSCIPINPKLSHYCHYLYCHRLLSIEYTFSTRVRRIQAESCLLVLQVNFKKT
jgi:hypothetical protein